MEWETYFNRYKNRILNTAIVALALIVANNIFKVQHKTIGVLKENKERELKRNNILDEINQEDKKLKTYKNFLNKKDISLVIDNIGNIAKDAGIKITSVKPDPEQMFPLYVKYNFNLAINANDFLTLGKFISKLENSYDVYMIESFSVNLRSETLEESKTKETKGLSVNLKISTFLFKD